MPGSRANDRVDYVTALAESHLRRLFDMVSYIISYKNFHDKTIFSYSTKDQQVFQLLG